MSLTDLVSASLVDEYLAPVIDCEIRRQQQLKDGGDRAPGLHPSEVAGACPRLVCLWRSVRPEFHPPGDEIDVWLQRIFDDGTMHHLWYQERYLGPAGVLYGTWVCSRCKREVVGFMPKDSCDCHKSVYSQHMPEFCIRHCAVEMPGEGVKERLVLSAERTEARGGCIACGQRNPVAWGEWKFREPKIKVDDIGLVGHSDGLVCVDDRWFVLEIKTANARSFTMMKGVSPGYKGQAHCYLYAFKQMPEPYSKVEGVLFLFVNKNEAPKIDGKRRKEREWTVWWDDEAEVTIEGIREMNRSLLEKSLPRMLPGCSQSKRNRDCQFWEVCARVGRGVEGWQEAEEYDG